MNALLALMLLGFAAVNCSQSKCTKQNGGWGEWMNWSPCSVSCGQGVRRAHRYCDSPIPKHGGAKCVDDSFKEETCNDGPCPKTGTPGDYQYVGSCTKRCNGGTITKRRSCVPPTDNAGASCYEDCTGLEEITEPCNTRQCFEVDSICSGCKRDAELKSTELGEPDFVGHNCRIAHGKCRGKTGGIKDMYVANDWFFIHCSADGPWCKPCTTRTLVYNEKCGQCEATREGPCTGPMKLRNNSSKRAAKDVLNDEDLW